MLFLCQLLLNFQGTYALIQVRSLSLLDEPSAALDVMAESKIFENFFNLCREKIGIYITHRVKIAQNASKIVVMENGSIVGIGTHKELLSKCKVYQELYAEESNFFDESKL